MKEISAEAAPLRPNQSNQNQQWPLWGLIKGIDIQNNNFATRLKELVPKVNTFEGINAKSGHFKVRLKESVSKLATLSLYKRKKCQKWSLWSLIKVTHANNGNFDAPLPILATLGPD
jgi:hypothetical protein